MNPPRSLLPKKTLRLSLHDQVKVSVGLFVRDLSSRSFFRRLISYSENSLQQGCVSLSIFSSVLFVDHVLLYLWDFLLNLRRSWFGVLHENL